MRRVWLGVMGTILIGLGWITLLVALADPEPVAGFIRPWLSGHDLETLGQNLILTGFGCIIVEALKEGFGALQRFFDAILTRTAKQPAHAVETSADPAPDVIVDRGWIKDRPYVVYADGSTEIETRIGMRRFKSHQDARAFVGG